MYHPHGVMNQYLSHVLVYAITSKYVVIKISQMNMESPASSTKVTQKTVQSKRSMSVVLAIYRKRIIIPGGMLMDILVCFTKSGLFIVVGMILQMSKQHGMHAQLFATSRIFLVMSTGLITGVSVEFFIRKKLISIFQRTIVDIRFASCLMIVI